MSIIEINALKKNYADVVAVNSIDLNISEGEMFGLVGPDGAGKTTTMRVLCGLTKPSGGEITIFGKDITSAKKEIQNNIGYLSQKFSLYGDLTVYENISFFANIHDVKNFETRADELLEMMRLIKFKDRFADKLSGGMKQKLALACSLIHEPKILFLDEPTTGVDPVSRRDFWKILSRLQADGITILLTTPYLDEAERCTRIGLMNNGEIIALGKPEDVKATVNMSVLEIYADDIRSVTRIIKENFKIETQAFGDRIDILTGNPQELKKSVATLLQKYSLSINESRTISPSLENIFIHLVNENQTKIK
ncbi:ABC transporter ATP-binding protein [Ignavibacteriales bacterium]